MTKPEPEAELSVGWKGCISGSLGKTEPTAHSEAGTPTEHPTAGYIPEPHMTMQDPNRLRSRLGPPLRKACDWQ